MLIISVFWLSLFKTLTALISEKIIKEENKLSYFKINALVVLLSWSASIPLHWKERDWFRGLIALNTWHNPTNILALLLSLLSFWLIVNYFEKKQYIKRISVAICLGLLTKPNFFVCLLPSIMLLALIKIPKHFLRILLWWVVPALLIIIAQFLWVYYGNYHDKGITQTQIQSSIGFGLGVAWRLHSGNILASILVSFFVPVWFCTFYFQYIKSETWFQLLAPTFVIGILLAYFVHENGIRLYHFNFSWQLSIVNYIFHVYCFRKWIKLCSKKLQWYDITGIIWVLISFMSGISHLVVTCLVT
ncbi:MAG: hypothetical protein NZM38_00535 [Cytophagales bacterium]|nr:hypothetical protein [Cytophagales bacterium]MDW8383234.1 hypothetical protein [Flammeovirgaceae bacterium]